MKVAKQQIPKFLNFHIRQVNSPGTIGDPSPSQTIVLAPDLRVRTSACRPCTQYMGWTKRRALQPDAASDRAVSSRARRWSSPRTPPHTPLYCGTVSKIFRKSRGSECRGLPWHKLRENTSEFRIQIWQACRGRIELQRNVFYFHV